MRKSLIKGIGGGSGSKKFFLEFLSDSENSDYALSGTFYGIEKACRAVVQRCREVGAYPKIL